MYMPEGFTTVTPYLFVKDAHRFVDFLMSAFGAIEIGRHSRPDGAIANAQIRIGSAALMVSEAGEKYGPMPTAFYLYVENADASMSRAIEHGARLEMEVGNMPYGDRQGGVVDPFGNIWWISQRLVNEPYY